MSSAIDRLYRRVLMMLAPVKITATNDTGAVHRVQIRVTPVEQIDGVPVVQLYGVASHAPVNSDAMAVFIHGDRSNPVIIATGNQAARVRNQKPGEVAIYTDEGDTIVLGRDHKIAITTKSTVTINAVDKVRIVAPRLEVTGDIIDHCDEQDHTALDMRTIYNSHTHRGVQPGTGNSGIPNQPQVVRDEP